MGRGPTVPVDLAHPRWGLILHISAAGGCRGGAQKASVVLAVFAIVGLAAAPTLHAARPADQAESDAMVALVQAENGLAGSVLQARVATVSTVDDGWAFVGVRTISGDAPLGLEYTDWALRRTAIGWSSIAEVSGVQSCSSYERLGIPLAVIDDLGLAAVTYRCAAPPLPRVVCLAKGGPNSVGRIRPRRCDISLEESTEPALANLRLLRGMRWTTWTKTRAVGHGKAIPVHAPFIPYNVTVVLWRPVDDRCGPVFTRGQVSSRFGRSGKRPLPLGGACR